MPSINRIRVNNVKYNFGTQFYDDFTMRMHGKNTLYDLANGGGKSVLMLLLLQNMIPNCTLDEKQPIEKLFRTGNGNTTIHSLVEWKLDEVNQKEGYRYMTTGFCARKAKDSDGGENENVSVANGSAKEVASIEYFNYCIFYRDYNKNDIVNLPLSKDGERVSFLGLRSYLKELEHRDMSLKVMVFDRKGEYQRFISGYGLHESQWEIIRGINKTEGHVRTYFENNYKTTRKVVEDLLIEEIIEKAYMVKTERDENGSDSMAKMLMDIKEQLTVLAKKKKDIASYDHQIELIDLLRDKVESFTEIFKEQSVLEKMIADICVTGAEFAKNDEQRMEELARAKDEKRATKDKQREKIECLKVARDKKQLEELLAAKKKLEDEISLYQNRLVELSADLNLKESVNEYIEYMEDRKKYLAHDMVIKTMMANSSFDETLLYTYAYNIKMRIDVMLTDIRSRMREIEEVLAKETAQSEYKQKLLSEATLELAVTEGTRALAKEEVVKVSTQLSDIRMGMHDIRFTSLTEQRQENEKEQARILERIKKSEEVREECFRLMANTQRDLSILEESYASTNALVSSLAVQEQAFIDASTKLSHIQTVYGVSKMEQLEQTISGRITKCVLDMEALREKMKLSKKRQQHLSEGRLFDVSAAAGKLIDYIETRHGKQAMFGMDYLSALPKENREILLEINPELAFGVLVEDYEDILEDPNILELDLGDSAITLYDKNMIGDKATHFGENAASIHLSAKGLSDEEHLKKCIEKEDANYDSLIKELEMKEEMLATYREDHTFVVRLSDQTFMEAGRKLEEARRRLSEIGEQIESLNDKIKNYQATIEKETKAIEAAKHENEKCVSDINHLFTMEQLASIVEEKEQFVGACDEKIKRLEEQIRTLKLENNDENRDVSEKQAQQKMLAEKERTLLEEWESTYKTYYDVDKEYDILTIPDDELKAKFIAMIHEGREDAKSIEDKKLLMDTLKVSMERSVKNIEKRGIEMKLLDDYEARGLIYPADENVLLACRSSIEETQDMVRQLEKELKDKASAADRMAGCIEYAISNIRDAFGSYTEEEASLAEITENLEHGEELLIRLEKEARECEEAYRRYNRQQGYMIDLYKDVKRIVTTHDISLEKATILLEDKEKLREIFESNLIRFDRNTKQLEKAKNELLKFKANTATALDQMSLFELAATIREDVVLPENYEAAKALMESLLAITDYIRLERDRVEKSLTDMETIKANFEEQCLQRCLDVKTELDKLPKLSRIIMDGEAISMVGLTVPYVKDEFLKQRMSDYIDRIVASADSYENDKERMKFIRNSLALKKLFGVIVTDMNGIKLSLYKRERIKEQSRYLKYEEAVGSTGQSQGIYIQFLVSIIHYISGMYQIGAEDIHTNTIFIDNPFGAAKDVYIWEPIFALLAANHVQLVVPARGVTPAITGRFDVNYILGQQMSGGRQLTVVTDYTSQVDQQELEYQDLDYEQVSFDFI